MEDQNNQVIEELLRNYRPGEDLSRVTTPEQRLDLMWQLVKAEYTRRGEHIDESHFRRDIEGLRAENAEFLIVDAFAMA